MKLWLKERHFVSVEGMQAESQDGLNVISSIVSKHSNAVETTTEM